MTLEARQRVVARLLTDPRYQESFFSASPGEASTHGLTQPEFEMLRGLDRKRLSISAEGYLGKRFERVESAFPRTLALLDRVEPGSRGRYLATTAFPRSETEEQTTFAAFVRLDPGRPPHLQRLLEDVLDLEHAILALPPARPFREPRPGARPRSTGLGLVRARGPLDEALGTTPAVPEAYPDSARLFLATREGAGVRLDALDPAGEAWLRACDGTRTWESVGLPSRGGDDAFRWLRAGVLEEA